jgi:hypothetical protein
MRLKVDERGLGRVLATLNVGKILIPALAELMKNVDRSAYGRQTESIGRSRNYRMYTENLLYNGKADLVAIPVRSSSHYIEVLSDVLQGKPFAEEDLDEISLLFLNKGVNVMVYDGGQLLQKGQISVPAYITEGHGNWVCLTFHDDVFNKMTGRFFANQRRMTRGMALPESPLFDNFMAEASPEDFQPVIEGIDRMIGSPSEVANFYKSDADSERVYEDDKQHFDVDDFRERYDNYLQHLSAGNLSEDGDGGLSELSEWDMQEPPDDVTWGLVDDLQELGNRGGAALSASSEDSFTATFLFEGNMETAQLWCHYKSSGVALAPVYEGVTYSASGGNVFFYHAKSIEKELGMVSFSAQEGRKVYDGFLRHVAGEVTSIEEILNGRMATDDLREIIDYFQGRLKGLVGDYARNFYILIPELKKVPNFRVPNVMACMRLLNYGSSDSEDIAYEVLRNLEEDKTVIIDNRYFDVIRNQKLVNGIRVNEGTHSAVCKKKNKPYPPPVPPMKFKNEDEKYKGRAYVIRLNKRLFEVIGRNPFVSIYTIVSDDGNILASDDEVSNNDDLGILVPDDMIVKGDGESLIISPHGNLSNRILAKGLVSPVYASRSIRLVRSEESRAAVIKLGEIARSDVIVFRNGKPYKIPYNRMQEYGIKRTTDRLDVAFMYEDRALMDPLYSIWRKGLKFPKMGDSVLISEVEAYDGVFLSEGDE